jgi:hypothetical protein
MSKKKFAVAILEDTGKRFRWSVSTDHLTKKEARETFNSWCDTFGRVALVKIDKEKKIVSVIDTFDIYLDH